MSYDLFINSTIYPFYNFQLNSYNKPFYIWTKIFITYSKWTATKHKNVSNMKSVKKKKRKRNCFEARKRKRKQ